MAPASPVAPDVQMPDRGPVCRALTVPQGTDTAPGGLTTASYREGARCQVLHASAGPLLGAPSCSDCEKIQSENTVMCPELAADTCRTTAAQSVSVPSQAVAKPCNESVGLCVAMLRCHGSIASWCLGCGLQSQYVVLLCTTEPWQIKVQAHQFTRCGCQIVFMMRTQLSFNAVLAPQTMVTCAKQRIHLQRNVCETSPA
jgi:hypothetical protein